MNKSTKCATDIIPSTLNTALHVHFNNLGEARDVEAQQQCCREILSTVRDVLLIIDSDDVDTLGASSSSYSILRRICHDAVWRVADVLGHGNVRIRSFLLKEVLPDLTSNYIRNFVLDCIPTCVNTYDPYSSAGRASQTETDAFMDIDNLTSENDDEDKEEGRLVASLNEDLQLVVESLQFILKNDRHALVQILSTLHQFPGTAKLVYFIASRQMGNVTVSELPTLGRILMEIHFFRGLSALLKEMDPVLTNDSSNDVSEIQSSISLSLASINELYGGEHLVLNDSKPASVMDVLSVLIIYSQNPDCCLKFVASENFLTMLQQIIRLNQYDVLGENNALAGTLLKSAVDILVHLLLKGEKVSPTLVDLMNMYFDQIGEYSVNLIRGILAPNFYDAVQRNQQSCSNNAKKFMSLEFCYYFPQQEMSNVGFHYFLYDAASILENVKCHVHGLLDVLLRWGEYYDGVYKEFYFNIAKCVVKHEREDILRLTTQKLLYSKDALIGIALAKASPNMCSRGDGIMRIAFAKAANLHNENNLVFLAQYFEILQSNQMLPQMLQILRASKFLSEYNKEKRTDMVVNLIIAEGEPKWILCLDILPQSNSKILTRFLEISISLCAKLGTKVAMDVSSNDKSQLMNKCIILSHSMTLQALVALYKMRNELNFIHGTHTTNDLYCQYGNIHLVWNATSVGNDMHMRILALRHLRNLLRKRASEMWINRQLLREFTINHQIFAELVSSTAKLSSELTTARFNSRNCDSDDDYKAEFLSVVYNLVLVVFQIGRKEGWLDRTVLSLYNMCDGITRTYQQKSNNINTVAFEVVFVFFQQQVATYSPFLACVLLDILGVLSHGVHKVAATRTLIQKGLAQVYPMVLHKKWEIIDLNFPPIIFYLNFEAAINASESLFGQHLRSILSEKDSKYKFLQHMQFSSWSLNPDKVKLFMRWFLALEKVVNAFGKKTHMSSKSIPMLNFSTFSAFYATLTNLLKLTMCIASPDKTISNPYDPILRLLHCYGNLLNLFAQNSKKFNEKYIKFTLTFSSAFVGILEDNIKKCVVWRNAQPVASGSFDVGSVNLLANLFQNCTNIAQITLNFCDLLQNNNFDVSDDDGIETDVNSAISQVQIVSALCKKIVKMLRDMSYDHNLAPPIAGQIHLNFPEAKTFDLPNEIVTNEETTAAQVAILQMKVTQSKVFEEIESDDGSEDNFGVVGDWGSDME